MLTKSLSLILEIALSFLILSNMLIIVLVIYFFSSSGNKEPKSNIKLSNE